MIDSLTRANHGDFNRRYVQTYGWLLNNDKKKLVYVTNSDDMYVYFRTGGDMEYHAVRDTGVQFEFIPVNRGWFNTYDSSNVYYLQRVPARQWKRGISSGNTQIQHWVDGRGLMPIKMSYEILEKIFNVGFDPHIPKDPMKTPVALSKDFAILGENIYFNDQVVGVRKENVLLLHTDLVQQELSDLINRRGYKYTVKVDHDNGN